MNSTTEKRSSNRFSSGVPESTRANRDFKPLMTRLVLASQFLIRWPSSRMIRSHLTCSMARISRRILPGAQFHAADDLLAVAFGKAPDFRFPLRFERSGANHQYFSDIDFTREKLSHAHALDRFAEAHVVGQNRPPPAGGDGNPIQLVRQQFR